MDILHAVDRARVTQLAFGNDISPAAEQTVLRVTEAAVASPWRSEFSWAHCQFSFASAHLLKRHTLAAQKTDNRVPIFYA